VWLLVEHDFGSLLQVYFLRGASRKFMGSVKFLQRWLRTPPASGTYRGFEARFSRRPLGGMGRELLPESGKGQSPWAATGLNVACPLRRMPLIGVAEARRHGWYSPGGF
jgi:hypothetical protein